VYLEQEIGDDFYQVYNLMKEKDDDYASAIAVMGQAKTKYLPLIIQLLVCEDSYY
jgi:NIMA (never in mitosis gene a)-related kinase